MTAYNRNLDRIFSENKYPDNLTLFKKIILLAREGLLQVNGQFPDARKSLFANLIEGHRFVVDLIPLDAHYRHKLKTWLLDRHLNDCKYSFWESYDNEEYRGYTVEVPLNWWERLLNWLWGDVETAFWPLANRQKLNPEFQLYGLTLQMAEHGWLFEFKSSHIENIFSLETIAEEDDDLEKARNSRRIMLKPEIVDKLIQVEAVDERIFTQLNEPHPLSINVLPQHQGFRNSAMAEFRKTELIDESSPWYISLGRWVYRNIIQHLISLFSVKQQTRRFPKRPRRSQEPSPHTEAMTAHVLYDKDNLKITKYNGIYQIREKWPGYKNLICPGGGAKIFSLVGGYKACWERKLPFQGFAGSSAGAIMSILAFLGYEPEFVAKFFADFNQEVLLYNEWDKNGFSDTSALKAGLDYILALKVLQIIDAYSLDATAEAKAFLNEDVFQGNKITFRSLAEIKRLCPDCGFGDELIITASSIESQRTDYFSLKTTPDYEISAAGAKSASIPPLFKPSKLNGVLYTDGGLTSNFPVEVFAHSDESLLSMKGQSLESLGFYFDNGREQPMLNNQRQRVYRESQFMNFIIKGLSGIKDTKKKWQFDRTKLLLNIHSTILLHTDIPSTQFTVAPHKQKEAIQKGYEETLNHLDHVYSRSKGGDDFVPCQYMSEQFPSMEAIMVLCCFRQNQRLFDKLRPIAMMHGVSERRLKQLASRFTEHQSGYPVNSGASFSPRRKAKQSTLLLNGQFSDTLRLFVAIYPVLLRMQRSMFTDKIDYNLFRKARHRISLKNPLLVINGLKSLSSKRHLILALVVYCLEQYRADSQQDVLSILDNLANAILSAELDIHSPALIQNWRPLLANADTLPELLCAIRNKDWQFVQQHSVFLLEREGLKNIGKESISFGEANEASRASDDRAMLLE